MSRPRLQSITITIDDAQRVSCLFFAPAKARACYVLAHGAGAGMSHPFTASEGGRRKAKGERMRTCEA
jgi:uncharacterized protein